MTAGMEVDDGPGRVGGKRQFGPSRVCKYWQEGRCSKGDSCSWYHPQAGPSGRLDGRLGGLSAAGFGSSSSSSSSVDERVTFDSRSRRFGGPRGGGRAKRSATNRPRERGVCHFWLKGECNRGAACFYLHSYSSTPDLTMVTQLKGHTKAVKGIALASKLYTGSQDKTIRVWDCGTGQCTEVVQMPSEVGTLIYSAGFLFIGLENQVQVWNMLQEQRSVSSLTGPSGQVYALELIVDTLFAGSHDGKIYVWKYNAAVAVFQPVQLLTGHTHGVVTLISAGGRLYSGSVDKSIMVWDVATLTCLMTLKGDESDFRKGHRDVVMSVLCYKEYLLSCSLDGYIMVWEATGSGELKVTYTHPEEYEKNLDGALTMCGAFDADGKPVILCAYNDNTVRVLDLPTFQIRGQLFSKDEVRTLHVAAPGGPGALLFTGDSSGDVKVWCWSKPSATSI